MVSDKKKGKTPKPFHDLNKVKELAKNDKANHDFARKAVADVITHIEIMHGGRRMANYAAEDFILEELSNLDVNDYHGYKELETIFGKKTYDEYGKMAKGIPWYIKIGIAEENGNEYIEICSFHPPRWDLRVYSGVIKKYEGG